MLTDLIKSNEYKSYRTTTIIKDFLISFLCLSTIEIVIAVTYIFLSWKNISIEFANNLEWVYIGIRINCVVAFLISMFYHKESHSKSLHKLKNK